MTEEHNNITNEEQNNSAASTGDLAEPGFDDFDIESALAAVSSLREIAEEPDHQEASAPHHEEETVEAVGEDANETGEGESPVGEIAPVALPDEVSEIQRTVEDVHADDAVYSAIPHRAQAAGTLEHPPISRLYRGQMASVVPAMLLIAGGAALTFLLTTTENTPGDGLLASTVVVAFGIVLLAQWLGSRRWSQGSFFLGMTALLSGALWFFTAQSGNLALDQIWPLFVALSGLALILTYIIAAAWDTRSFVTGLLLILLGGAGYVWTGGLLDPATTQTLINLWPVGMGILAVLVVIGFIGNRTRQ